MNIKNELALTRTYLAFTRTYLAGLRTNAIFIGIIVALMQFSKKKIRFGILLLTLSLLINILITYEYYNILINTKHHIFKKGDNKYIYIISPIAFGFILILLQIIFFYYLSQK